MHLLIAGGSPIFRSGLAHLSRLHFPDLSISSEDGTLPSAGAFRNLIVLDAQADSGELRTVARRHRKRDTLLVGLPVALPVVERMVREGLAGYLLRNATVPRLVEALGHLFAGKPFIDPRLRAREAVLRPLVEPLTRRERQVLGLIVQEHTTDEIAASLFIGRCTVETHRAHILQKLGVRNTAGIVREAMRRNLCGV